MPFPKNFLWGAAISSYQVEGNNFNNDWWEWEQKGKIKDKCGKACDYWNRWPEDHALLSELGVNAFRLSLEWSRIEPAEGKFSEEVIAHYRELLADLRKRNIKTIVTFWHWASPLWFQKKYGFHKKESAAVFVKYVEEVTKKIGSLVDIFVVINEPMVPLGEGYLTGQFPPGYRSFFKFWQALNNLAQAYRESYQKIHEIKKDAIVGLTCLYNWYDAEEGNFLEKIANNIALGFQVNWFMKKVSQHQDYLGLDYYRLGKIKFDPKNSAYFGFRIAEDEKNIMKWMAYPEGIFRVLKEAWEKYHLPIYIMENGLPTDRGLMDKERVNFIQEHLKWVERALQAGVDVRGYCHWSLLDNYEWLSGFQMRFGLAEVDYQTLERQPRKSFYAYKEIIKNNS